MKIQFRVKDLTERKPIPDGSYTFTIEKLSEKTFESGAWGFEGELRVSEGEHENGRCWENYVLLDNKGGLSKAAFRFAQLYKAATGDEQMVFEAETTEEAREIFLGYAESLIDKTFNARTEVEESKGYSPRANIVEYM